MRLFSTLLLAFSACGSALVTLDPVAQQSAKSNRDLIHHVSRRATVNSLAPNGPNNRGAWLPGYDITNDTDTIFPSTGCVREYHFTLRDATCNPDGHGPVSCMLVNDQLPGPAIVADWGDTVRVHVTNLLKTNGTSIHFHGVNQLNTNRQDGVNGVTECPLAPNLSRTYEWRATQHGSSWYHSHHTTQYGAGVYGPIVLNGPATANFDLDLGPAVISDYWYEPGFEVAAIAEEAALKGTAGLTPDNFLFNGKAKDAQGNGQYETFHVASNRTHRLRLINTATESAVHFAVEGHNLLVIAADFVPVEPYQVSSLMVGIAQRYDVVVKADQPSGAYWVRAEAESACGGSVNHRGLAVLKYDSSNLTVPAGGEPTDNPYATPCQAPSLTPYWPSDAGSASDFAETYQPLLLDYDPTQIAADNGTFIIWKFNKMGIDTTWADPTLSSIADNTSYPPSAAVFEIPSTQKYAYYVIQNKGGIASFIPHPIHLHGHDYYVLGRGKGVFNTSDLADLNFKDPIRRDTEYIDGDNHTQTGSWLALSWKLGNPGAWLLHCHISSHIAGGMGLQFVEQKEQIPRPGEDYYDQCKQWQTWWDTAKFPKIDSGLR